jgi:thiol-disulfide isomerase/thioredoxin
VAPEFRGAQFSAIGRRPRARGSRALQLALCLAAALFGTTANAQSNPATTFVSVSNAPKPAFTLTDASGAPHSLTAGEAQVVLVHFFATWCEPCREELPALDRLAARAGVAVIAVSVADSEGAVRTLLRQIPVTFPVVLDRDRAVAKAWDVDGLPTTFVLDHTLKPRLKATQDVAWDKVDIARLIASSAIRKENDHDHPSP